MAGVIENELGGDGDDHRRKSTFGQRERFPYQISAGAHLPTRRHFM
ncbi:MAG: hypothetical protein IPK66_11335 [Rhodospirillales bacterium]|nr:hypothetical protein [Rhodospirillales bacterium]